MSTKAFAVIAGVGSGTGTSLARRFAKEYPIALLARNPESYEGLVQEINNSGGKAIGISTDASDEESVKSAFMTIAQKYENAPCAAAIYNASGGFVRKPFLETQIEDLEKGWAVTVYGKIVCLPKVRAQGISACTKDGTWKSVCNASKFACYLAGDGVHKRELVVVSGVVIDTGRVEVLHRLGG